MPDSPARPFSPPIRGAVPPLFGWRSYPSAVLNLIIFGFAALGCEWLVHQVQYLLEYGNRFGMVMANGPHRLYMARAGFILLVAVAGLAAGLTIVLSYASKRRRVLEEALPARLRRFIPACAVEWQWSAIGRTSLALALCQMTLYLLQENLESATVSGAWPGIWVFLAPGHLTVTPLHLLAAISSSIVLWTVVGLLRRSRHGLQVARALLSIVRGLSRCPLRLVPLDARLPSLRPRLSDLGLRSPPLVRA